MIIRQEVNGVKYEGVLEGFIEPTGEVQQYEVVVHDPDNAGGRRKAFLCKKDEIPVNHVTLGTIAIK